MRNKDINNQYQNQPRYRLILMCLGIVVGTLFGIIFDNMLLIIPAGILGSGIGIVIDNKNRKNK